MTPFLVCLATVLCLVPASVLSHSHAGECQRKCLPYHNIGYQCAQRNGCILPLDDDYKEECYASCMLLYDKCHPVCQEHYNNITATCQAQCSGASPSCENSCFDSELEKILSNPTKREVSIWQTVPVLGRQRREAEDDSTKRVSPRDDSKRSSGSTSSEEVGDIFGIWRKKRDTKRSPGSTSSMDLDDFLEDWTNKRDSKRSPGSTSSEDVGDIFGIWRRDTKRSPGSTSSMDMDDWLEDWTNKRDTKRSPGSTSSMDMDDWLEDWTSKRDTKRSPGSTSSMDMDDWLEDWTSKRNSKRSPGTTSSEDVGNIFGIRRRGQEWSWEEGNSEDGDVYGDWKDKRQAETEIQQQKQ